MSKKANSKNTMQEKLQKQPRQSLAQKLLEVPEQIITLNQPLPPSDYSKRSATLNVGRGRITREVILRKRNEMVGIFYVCIALLIFAGLIIEKEGQVKVLVEKFAALNGVGPVFLALFAIFCGMKRLMGYEVFKRNSQILAFPVMYFSLIGFLAALFPQANGSISLGGIVGNYFFWLLQTFLGTISAGIVMGAIFLISFMHVTEVYVSDIVASLYRFLRACSQKLLRWSLFLCVVFKESSWFCIRKIHQFLYVLIHDSILLLEKGVRPFGIQIFQSEPRVFVDPSITPEHENESRDGIKEGVKEPEEESETSLLFGRSVEIKTEAKRVQSPVTNQSNHKTSSVISGEQSSKEKPRAITVQVEREEPSSTSAEKLRVENIVEERELQVTRKLEKVKTQATATDGKTSVRSQKAGEGAVESSTNTNLDEAYLELENISPPGDFCTKTSVEKPNDSTQMLLESKVLPKSSELKELLAGEAFERSSNNKPDVLEEPQIQEEKLEQADLKYPEQLPDIDFLQPPPDDSSGDSEDEL